MPQFIYHYIINNDYISIVRLQTFMLQCSLICCSVLIFDLYIMLIGKLVLHFVPSWHGFISTLLYNVVTSMSINHLIITFVGYAMYRLRPIMPA